MRSLFNFSPSESLAVLRALKTVAMADGNFAMKEQAMLVASAELLGVDAEPRDLPTVSAAELAAVVVGPSARVVALKACLVMAIVDGQISPEEWKVLSAFRGALAIDEAQLHSKNNITPWHGWQGRGRPVMTIVRGQVVMRDGELVADQPRGQLVRPVVQAA